MINSKDQGTLKACPFCGGKPVLRERVLAHHSKELWYRIQCGECLAETKECRPAHYAIECWNRRPPLAAEPVQMPERIPCSRGDMTADDLDRLVDWLCHLHAPAPQADHLYRAQVALLHLAKLMREGLPTLQSDLAQARESIAELERQLDRVTGSANAWAETCRIVEDEREKLQADLTEARGILAKCIKQFEDMDENRPLDAGCIECTAGTVPNNRNTGLCGYHKAKGAV